VSGVVVIWDAATQLPVGLFALPVAEPVSAITWLADGRWLIGSRFLNYFSQSARNLI
jgi:hypothetical protein